MGTSHLTARTQPCTSLWGPSTQEIVLLPLLGPSVHSRGWVLLEMTPCTVFDPKISNLFQTGLFALDPLCRITMVLCWSTPLSLSLLWPTVWRNSASNSSLRKTRWAIHFLRSSFSKIFIPLFCLNDYRLSTDDYVVNHFPPEF